MSTSSIEVSDRTADDLSKHCDVIAVNIGFDCNQRIVYKMEKTDDVYTFVDEEDNHLIGRDSEHKQYVRYSLAKDWNQFGHKSIQKKTKKEFRIKFEIKKSNDMTEVMHFNYKQFFNHFQTQVKTYYTFLPLNQINELVRQLWIKLKRKQQSKAAVPPKYPYSNPKALLKSSIKTRHELKKKVSFNLTESQSDSHSEGINHRFRPQNDWSKKKTKQRISRFVKPLDISYKSPERGLHSHNQLNKICVQPNTHFDDKSPPINDSSEDLLEYSPQSRPLSPQIQDTGLDDGSQQMTSDLENNCLANKLEIKNMTTDCVSPERGRHSHYNFNELNNSPKMDSGSEELLENSPQFRGDSPEKHSNMKLIERKETSKANMDSFCSPLLNELNSTKSLKKLPNNSLISRKRKPNRVLRNKSNATILSSKKALFQSPVKQLTKQTVPTKTRRSTRCKTSIPMNLTENQINKIVFIKEIISDSLCDLFETDVSQMSDIEISLNSELLKN